MLCLTVFELDYPASVPLASSLGLNCIISYSSPVHILGLLSLCNCTSQFLMINLSACLSVYIYMEIYILYLLLTFLVEARCFTGSCQFPRHSRAGRLYVSTCPLLDSLPFSHHRALMSSRCYPTSVHSRVNTSIAVSRCIPPPHPFLPLLPTFVLCICPPPSSVWLVPSLEIPNTRGIWDGPHADPLPRQPC